MAMWFSTELSNELGAGACFSKVLKTFQTRKAICETEISLLGKMNLWTCFQDLCFMSTKIRLKSFWTFGKCLRGHLISKFRCQYYLQIAFTPSSNITIPRFHNVGSLFWFFFFQSSFHALKTWIKELTRYGPPDILIAIAGNKCDKADQREVIWKGIKYH